MWSVVIELIMTSRLQMLYKWLASMPHRTARTAFASLMERYPLIYNAQDNLGRSILMYAAEDSHSEVVKVIIGENHGG